jgi:hypothetical protein
MGSSERNNPLGCYPPAGRDRAEGEEMSGAARRQSNWTAEEDRRLLELVEAQKSWVFISANLKRPERSAREHFAYLRRKEKKPNSNGRLVKLGLKAKK